MPYYVYILKSVSFLRFYIGQSNNLQDRLHRHNQQNEKATAPYAPWELIWHTQKNSRVEAIALEKKLKNLSRKRIESFMEKYPSNAGADDSSQEECRHADP